MELLDEHGRVFGVVNIIDLLVVLFVVAVAVAGVALVVGPGEPSEPSEPQVTQTVTVGLGTHPPDGAALVEPGTAEFGEANATITDVYRTPNGDGVRVVANLRVQGQMDSNVFTVGGAPVRYGSVFSVATPEYQHDGNVIGVGGNDSISTTPVTATLTTTVSPAIADAVEPGDEYRLAGQPVATIRDVTRNRTEDDRVQLTVRAEFVARTTASGPVYGDAPIRIGRELTIATNRYQFTGQVTDVEQ
ncbi:DUF4330 family protein [Halosegnis longus]|uniref:DUF4330 family protein n=1 Tax=Halosegnis longus TaxID=2216012 RepID=UPI00129DB2C8|nr:DUF4330 family protein [Halosegnis longus]